MELSGDGYEGDVLGESTPDVIVSEVVRFFLFILFSSVLIMFCMSGSLISINELYDVHI